MNLVFSPLTWHNNISMRLSSFQQYFIYINMTKRMNNNCEGGRHSAMSTSQLAEDTSNVMNSLNVANNLIQRPLNIASSAPLQILPSTASRGHELPQPQRRRLAPNFSINVAPASNLPLQSRGTPVAQAGNYSTERNTVNNPGISSLPQQTHNTQRVYTKSQTSSRARGTAQKPSKYGHSFVQPPLSSVAAFQRDSAASSSTAVPSPSTAVQPSPSLPAGNSIAPRQVQNSRRTAAPSLSTAVQPSSSLPDVNSTAPRQVQNSRRTGTVVLSTPRIVNIPAPSVRLAGISLPPTFPYSFLLLLFSPKTTSSLTPCTVFCFNNLKNAQSVAHPPPENTDFAGIGPFDNPQAFHGTTTHASSTPTPAKPPNPNILKHQRAIRAPSSSNFDGKILHALKEANGIGRTLISKLQSVIDGQVQLTKSV